MRLRIARLRIGRVAQALISACTAALLLAACSPSSSPAGSGTSLPDQRPASDAASSLAATSAVEKLVAAAPAIKAVPKDLTPSLVHPGDDGAPACPQAAVTIGPGNYCVYGDQSSAKTIALLGDSHAGEWTYALAALAQRAGYKLYRFSLPACPAPNVHFIAPQTNQPNTDCDKYHTLAEAKIKSLHPDILVVTSSTKQLYDSKRQPVTPAAWQAGLESTIKAASAATTKAFVLGDYAYLPVAAPDCLAAHQGDVGACSATKASQDKGTLRAAEKPAATAAGATYIDTIPWVCSDTCTAVIGHYLVYKDLYHLTEAYTEYLEGPLAQAMGLNG